MQRTTFRGAMAVLMLALLGLSEATAGDYEFTNYSDIEAAYNAQSQELSTLRNRLATIESRSLAETGSAPCDDAACGCDDCCCAPCGAFIGGGGVYFLKPHWDSNPAFQILDPAVSPDPIQFVDFNYDFAAAPVGWVGYVGPGGFGARVRYFEYDQTARRDFQLTQGSPLVVTAANPLGASGMAGGNTDADLVFTARTELDVWDFEGLVALQNGPWSLWIGGGVRYLYLGQQYQADFVFPNSNLHNVLSSERFFNGVGPTLSLEGRVACGESGFGLYGLARGSVLFGEGRQFAQFTSNNNVLDMRVSSTWDVLSVGEIEVGGLYEHAFSTCSWVTKVGFVGQVWQGAGNNSNSSHVGTTMSSSDFGLFGFVVSTGVNY